LRSLQGIKDTILNERELRVFEPGKKAGLILVMTGEGKGKSSAALGIALRAAGYDMRVCIIEFMKGNMYSGEIDGIKKLAPHVELHITGKGFYRPTDDPKKCREHRAKAQDALALAKEKMLSGKYDILILDEINIAVTLKLVDLQQVLEFIESRPPLMHLVLTGRDAHPEIIRRAHTVTEMKDVKHAYEQGIEPQKGIDY
jgi:cob(I)alamin adenosyltransferase